MASFEMVRELTVDADTAWARIGAFDAVGMVLPKGACTAEGEGIGATRSIKISPMPLPTVEKILDAGERWYVYTMTEGLLPLRNYRATFKVEPTETGSRVTWSGEFGLPIAVPPDLVVRGMLANLEPTLDGLVAIANGAPPPAR